MFRGGLPHGRVLGAVGLVCAARGRGGKHVEWVGPCAWGGGLGGVARGRGGWTRGCGKGEGR